MDFITIKRTYGNPPNSDTAPLGIDSKHEGLRVIGGLPNWSYVEPADVEAAQALLSWLLAWMAKHGATPKGGKAVYKRDETLIRDADGFVVCDVYGRAGDPSHESRMTLLLGLLNSEPITEKAKP